jgi:cytidine deaminase
VYRVGAALLTDDGEIINGCNVENASYGECGTARASREAISSSDKPVLTLVYRGHHLRRANGHHQSCCKPAVTL